MSVLSIESALVHFRFMHKPENPEGVLPRPRTKTFDLVNLPVMNDSDHSCPCNSVDS